LFRWTAETPELTSHAAKVGRYGADAKGDRPAMQFLVVMTSKPATDPQSIRRDKLIALTDLFGRHY
jgi:hypothetical protein